MSTLYEPPEPAEAVPAETNAGAKIILYWLMKFVLVSKNATNQAPLPVDAGETVPANVAVKVVPGVTANLVEPAQAMTPLIVSSASAVWPLFVT